MKAQFLTPLRAERLPGKYWKLVEPLVYYSALLDATLTAPVGFVSDMASVPRLPVAYWLFGGKADAPAVIHDRCYRFGDISRADADKVFCEAMKAEGKWFTTRWPMTAAVMAFGGLVYNPRPGCLDIRRKCKSISGTCITCRDYMNDWPKTIQKGFTQ